MNLLKFHTQPFTCRIPQTTCYNSSLFRHHLKLRFKFTPCSSSSLLTLSLHRPTFKFSGFSRINAAIYKYEEAGGGEAHPIVSAEFEDLAPNGVVYQKTLRLVECSMFAAVTGLLYFLSNSLSIENYFGCFFALPIVISSLRWGIAAGRKTMVATAMLLFVLSGPVKALIYLLTHGLTGLTLGSLWRLGADWRVSIVLCTIVRAMGAVGYVLTTSFLISENILALITINIHASLTLIFAATGINIVPSMNIIYAIFGTLVLLNCGFFVFLLHLLYSVFLTRLGMRGSLSLPNWLEKALG
ncbi:hypothetical protein HS088_TW22G01477 [Tripterygium wilfordii]|uniref:DUF2232 domain-containing protein n=1 Tax=Tripterygium wilfordii TaxID=458696 RepID=A0A7J7C0U9_TRIWF|nr:uncharacterized protein LOC119991172 [Tripterygium wilfordii]KAF5727780.1 hypothetical protein HS088_TW22G01477 [Tripterygium wilfordii]